MNSFSSITAGMHTRLSEKGGEIKWPNSHYRYIRHGSCRRAYKILWGSQSTSNLRIFGLQKPISDVKTPKTSTCAIAGGDGRSGCPKDATADENVQVMHTLVMCDMRRYLRSIASKVVISFGAVQSILTHILCMSKV